jgi:hypothetical protein
VELSKVVRVAFIPILTGRRFVAEEQKLNTDDARAGSSEHVVRYVLGASLALAIIAMVVILVSW